MTDNSLFKHAEHKYGIIIVTILAIIINRNLLISSEYPAGNNMLGWISQTSFFSQNFSGFYYIWSSQWFGQVQPWMIHSLLIMLNFIIGNPVETVNFFIFIIFLFAGLSMYFFTYYYTKSELASIFSSIVFISNQYFISIWTSGHLNFAFMYSMGPILLFNFDRAVRIGRLKDIILLSISSIILVIFSRLDSLIYWGGLLFIYCIFNIIFPFNKNRIKNILFNYLKILTFGTIFFFIFGAFQFLPNLLGARPEYYQFKILFPLDEIKFWTLDFYYSLRGLPREVGYLYWLWGIKWDMHTFLSKSQYYFVTTIPFILAFMVLLFDRSKKILFFCISILLFLLLAKGTYPPLDKIYSWLYFNVPFFGFLHVPNRWLILIWFLISFLSGATIKKLYDFFKNHFFRRFDNSGNNSNFISMLGFSPILIILTIILFLPTWPVFEEGLQSINIQELNIKPYLYIKEQNDDSRVIGVPFAQSYMFIGKMWVHDLNFISTLFHNKPFVAAWEFATPGNPEYLLNYASYLIHQKGTDRLMKILGVFDIKYMVIQRDIPTLEIPPGYDSDYQYNFFENQKGLKTAFTFANATVYKNEYWTPRIFTTSKSALVIGGRESLMVLAENDEFNFSKETVFFANQVMEKNGKSKIVDLINKSDVVFVNSELLDLVLLMLDETTIFKTAEYAYPSIDAKEHWIASDSTTKSGMFTLNPMTLSTSGENNVSIRFKSDKEGSYEIWGRLIFDKNVGKLTISADDKAIGSIVPYSEIRDIKWIKMGNIDLGKGEHALTLQNKKSGHGVTNEIDEILFVEPARLAYKIDEVNKQLENSNRIIVISETQRVGKKTDFLQRSNFPKLNYQQSVFKDYSVYYTKKEGENEIKFPDIFKADDLSPEVNFTKINPTKYKVKVKADKPFFLIFSDSYHPLWKAYIDGEEVKSIISYSFINGFDIQKTGEYEMTIEFIGQRYVWIGGIISLTTFIFAISYILFENKMLQIFSGIRRRLYGRNN